MTLPLKFPLRVKLPVSVVWPDAKHEPFDVMVKFVMLNPLPPVSVSVVVKEKSGCPPDVLIRLALQFPLMVVAFDPPPPHPTKVNTSATVAIIQTGLCTVPPCRCSNRREHETVPRVVGIIAEKCGTVVLRFLPSGLLMHGLGHSPYRAVLQRELHWAGKVLIGGAGGTIIG